MNMFARRVEPVAPVLPNPATMSEEVAGFIDNMARQREELVFFRSETDTLQNELKVAHEHIRRLEAELTDVRDQRDFLQRHDTAMLTSLHNIKVLIDASLASAKAQAYAPPGTGQQDHTQEKIDDAVAQLAQKLAAEQTTEQAGA